jgi:hypothetical protein
MHGGIITEYNDDVKGFLQFYKKLGMLPLETDSGIIMGIAPQHRKILEVLMLNAIKAWEKVKAIA